MRQINNCKVGHFVKYEGIVCQVNCMYKGWRGTRVATLVQVGEPGERRRMFTPEATEKAEYLGPVVSVNGKIWVGTKEKHNPFI